MSTPILAQHRQRMIGERDVTILLSFAQLHVDRFAFGVDILDLEMNTFPQPQSTGIDRTQANSVPLLSYAAQHPLYFCHAEYHGEFLFPSRAHQV